MLIIRDEKKEIKKGDKRRIMYDSNVQHLS
jgi:hypothetical protein